MVLGMKPTRCKMRRVSISGGKWSGDNSRTVEFCPASCFMLAGVGALAAAGTAVLIRVL
jgi:hypothetical protein